MGSFLSLRWFVVGACLLLAGVVQAQTYSNKSKLWAAIDPSIRTKITHNSSPIKFYKPSGPNCGTS